MDTTAQIRSAKTMLIAAMGFFFTLVVFNNVTDFNSNYQFVHHVLMMDTTFPGNKGMWRAISAPWVHLVFYLSIICWEALNAFLCWWSAAKMFATRNDAAGFIKAKGLGVVSITAGMLLWFVAFLCVGAEWFLMWQSKWNGQEAAFRMFACEGILLIILLLPE